MTSARVPHVPSISSRLAQSSLTPALRQVAELLLVDPEAVAFGTVASVAERAGTSTPTVVRTATALGYDGFAHLREAARAELSMRLSTDAVRVRSAAPASDLDALRDAECSNVTATLDGLDRVALGRAIHLLDNAERQLWVLPSTQTEGVAERLVDQFHLLGRRAVLLVGSEFRISTSLAAVRRGDVVMTIDIPRHEPAMLRMQALAVHAGAVPVVVTGSVPTALATDGGVVLPFASTSVWPFDSLVGLTVVANLLINSLSERRQPEVAKRLADLESAWTRSGALRS
ncbi:MAG: MurR/RpiR family transcriptional regulator [Acidimicrobiaceae bacterium]|nr:MurR/RpiR family transcriptional regulator [Acidimicrobiaceae bacterium]